MIMQNEKFCGNPVKVLQTVMGGFVYGWSGTANSKFKIVIEVSITKVLAKRNTIEVTESFNTDMLQKFEKSWLQPKKTTSHLKYRQTETFFIVCKILMLFDRKLENERVLMNNGSSVNDAATG